MRKRIVLLLAAVAVAVLALLASGQSKPLTANAEGEWPAPQGSWAMIVKPDIPPAPGVTEILNLATFMPDGGWVSSDGYITDSLAHGNWVRIGNRQFAVTAVGLSFGPSGHTEATFKVR